MPNQATLEKVREMDVNWHAGPFADSSGISIEWYTEEASQTEMRRMLEDALDRAFEMEPLDGGSELTYQYHLVFE